MKLGKLLSLNGKAEEGVWKDYGAGLRVKVAPTSNKKFTDFIAKAQRGKRRGFRGNREGQDKDLENLTMEAVAHTVLLGWEGLEEDDGSPIPYSPEKALEIFRLSHIFYRDIMEIATEVDAEVRGGEEEEEGNSETS